MRFHVWFRKWRRYLHQLLTPRIPRKSKRERQKKRAEHVKYMATRYRYRKPLRHSRRSSWDVTKEHTISSVFGFLATSLSALFLAPFWLIEWASKKRRKVKKSASASSASCSTPTARAGSADPVQVKKPQASPTPTPPAQPKSTAQPPSAEANPVDHEAQAPKGVEPSSVTKGDISSSSREDEQQADVQESSAAKPTPQPSHLSSKEAGFVPISLPKSPSDRCIRERMIIAGSSYCKAAKKLARGEYLTLQPEPDNPHDKNAVAILHGGERVGYVARHNQVPILTSLRLGRTVYGVITEVQNDVFPSKYEYEVWFSYKSATP